MAHSEFTDGSSSPGSGTRIPVLDDAISAVVGNDDWKHWLKKRMRTRKMGQSSELAEQAGIRDTNLMFVTHPLLALHVAPAFSVALVRKLVCAFANLFRTGTCPTTSPA